jgi:hypothetical protein
MGLLSDAPYVVSLDAASLARMRRLLMTGPIFARYYQAAMNSCVAKVVQESKTAASEAFRKPTGKLMGGITGQAQSPWRGVVGVGQQVPYARRREFGFSGMTDALGRYYNLDPGAFYLHTGLQRAQPYIRTTFFAATELAMRDVII